MAYNIARKNSLNEGALQNLMDEAKELFFIRKNFNEENEEYKKYVK